jgi:hypothetical protein
MNGVFMLHDADPLHDEVLEELFQPQICKASANRFYWLMYGLHLRSTPGTQFIQTPSLICSQVI